MADDNVGTGYAQNCPLTGTHRYYMTKSLETYERLYDVTYEDEPDMTLEQIDAVNGFLSGHKTYTKKEMALLNCGCGSAIMKEIERV